MSEELNQCISNAKSSMDRAIEHLKSELVKIRAGKAHTGILDGILADAYGAATPINQLGNISTPDSKTIAIQPWDRSLLQPIERAIMEAIS